MGLAEENGAFCGCGFCPVVVVAVVVELGWWSSAHASMGFSLRPTLNETDTRLSTLQSSTPQNLFEAAVL